MTKKITIRFLVYTIVNVYLKTLTVIAHYHQLRQYPFNFQKGGNQCLASYVSLPIPPANHIIITLSLSPQLAHKLPSQKGWISSKSDQQIPNFPIGGFLYPQKNISMDVQNIQPYDISILQKQSGLISFNIKLK